MRTVFALCFLGMLALPSFAQHKHLSKARQLHIKPTMLFGSGGVLLGPSVALEIPVVKHFSLGGMLNTNHYFGRNTTTILDINLYTKFFYPLRLSTYHASAYLAAPLGFSLAFGDKIGPGFNFALLPGFEFYIDRHWGLFSELGLNLHHIASPSLVLGQFSIGVSYLF